jgi:hypothetical protein
MIRVASHAVSCMASTGSLRQPSSETTRPVWWSRRVVVAIGPVNFEKRLARGYPAITAAIVNLRVPAVTCANRFSYSVGGQDDPNGEVCRSIRMTHSRLASRSLRYVGDAGLYDQKVYRWIERF